VTTARPAIGAACRKASMAAAAPMTKYPIASRLRSPSPGSIFAEISVMATIAPRARKPSSTHGRRIRSTIVIATTVRLAVVGGIRRRA
jgi:hypothetical protein